MSKLTLTRAPLSPLFDEFMNEVLAGRPIAPVGAMFPAKLAAITRARMDVLDKGDAFEVTMDLPGVKREDIKVSIEGPRVSVTAETKTEREEKEGEKLLHSERFAASYARNFELPAEVNEGSAEAKFEDGVLTLILPKRAPVMSKTLTVK